MSKTELVTKDESLKMLSAHLRKRGLQDKAVIKLLETYSKLSGWKIPKTYWTILRAITKVKSNG